MKSKDIKSINSTEIAKIAGLSRSTVSRVINQHPNVKGKTREKILNLIEQYGYTPNLSARVLAGKRADTIGLFFVPGTNSPNFAGDTQADFMLACIAEAASQNGFLTLTNIVRNIHEPENVKRIRDIFYEGRIDAGIFIGCPDQVPIIEELVASGFILGILDQNPQGRNESNRIIVNYDDGSAEKAVDYLVSLGHRRIMGIHGDLKRYNGLQKYHSFLRGMEKHDLEVKKEWQLFPGFQHLSSYSMMEDFLNRSKELPTAMFCANDSIAWGVMDALKKAGLSIPGDLSIIGMDDSSFSALLSPPLTTFRVDFQEVLGTLTKKVIEHVATPSDELVRIAFESDLVMRGSCRTICVW
ncbi:MAG: LacI family transcriptional regulator [Clostridia bacterium]|nr:LacI family transcriptional regulator [Clostridia bacterium]